MGMIFISFGPFMCRFLAVVRNVYVLLNCRVPKSFSRVAPCFHAFIFAPRDMPEEGGGWLTRQEERHATTIKYPVTQRPNTHASG